MSGIQDNGQIIPVPGTGEPSLGLPPSPEEVDAALARAANPDGRDYKRRTLTLHHWGGKTANLGRRAFKRRRLAEKEARKKALRRQRRDGIV